MTTPSCGTVAAYFRHYRRGERGESIDELCRKAMNENNRKFNGPRGRAISRLIAEHTERYLELLAEERARTT